MERKTLVIDIAGNGHETAFDCDCKEKCQKCGGGVSGGCSCGRRNRLQQESLQLLSYSDDPFFSRLTERLRRR